MPPTSQTSLPMRKTADHLNRARQDFAGLRDERIWDQLTRSREEGFRAVDQALQTLAKVRPHLDQALRSLADYEKEVKRALETRQRAGR